MKEELNKINKTIQKLDDKVDRIDKTLIAQHESLKHHVYRTDLAEERMTKFENKTTQDFKDVHKELSPVTKHVARVEGALKLLGLIALLVSIAGGIYRLII